MRATTRWMCLWPGGARLWRGEFGGLALAVIFAVLLNLVLYASFTGVPWNNRFLDVLGWTLVAGFWILGIRRAARERVVTVSGPPDDDQDLYLQAQAEYLRGHWFEAESLIENILSRDSVDPEARLLLATLYRHTGRYEEARRQLKRLERLDGAAKWMLEIQQERKLLERTQFPRLMEQPSSRQAA